MSDNREEKIEAIIKQCKQAHENYLGDDWMRLAAEQVLNQLDDEE